MQVLCIVPARGGSKRLPRKNLLPLGGRPLISHTLVAARRSRLVTRTVVSTDDAEIARVAREHGAEVVDRPAELASDDASSESALRHALGVLADRERYRPDLVVFLQVTSPLRGPADIDGAIATLQARRADSVFSGVRSHSFFWGRRDGAVVPLNYDYRDRKRGQDLPDQWIETGSVFVFKPEVLLEGGQRLGGTIAVHEVDPVTAVQVDSAEELEICELLLRHPLFHARRLPFVPGLVVLDFDGVLTTNQVMVEAGGAETVVGSRADSLGLSGLRRAGIPVVIVSTETSPVVEARARKLGLDCFPATGDKARAVRGICEARGVPLDRTLYVGNDLNDLSAMRICGASAAPSDAAPEVLVSVDLVLARPGGAGAVRELADAVLSAAGKGDWWRDASEAATPRGASA